jgi:dihydropteroate synthase
VSVSHFILRDQRFDLDTPRVMGILNATPDSFHAGSRVAGVSAADEAVRMVREGAAILDVGGQSSRPGAERVGPSEEWRRVEPALDAIRTALPDVPISIDTFHAEVARKALDAGADMINDISAGALDPELPMVVAERGVPYAIMHMQGTPGTMQDNPVYREVVHEVKHHLEERCVQLRALGIEHLVVDPGFGFGKTVQHNYSLLQHLDVLSDLGCPILVGVSRKSMIHRVLDCTSEEALNGTTALHAWALDRGAHWLRVHDVAPAVECIRLHQYLRASERHHD